VLNTFEVCKIIADSCTRCSAVMLGSVPSEGTFRLAQTITLLPVQEVRGSNHDQDAEYSDCSYSWFSLFRAVKFWIALN
jgi:hypothetical protein